MKAGAGASIALMAVMLAPQVEAEGLGHLLKKSQGEFDQARKQNAKDAARLAREAKEREQMRDKSRDFCYALPVGSDAQKACSGEYVVTIKDERARNIMQGYCYGFDTSSELSKDLSYICENGAKACSILDNGDAAYWCGKCGGTRNWLATYSLGHSIKCF